MNTKSKDLFDPSFYNTGVLSDDEKPIYFKGREAYFEALAGAQQVRVELPLIRSILLLLAKYNPESAFLPDIIAESDNALTAVTNLQSKLIDCYFFELEKKWKKTFSDSDINLNQLSDLDNA